MDSLINNFCNKSHTKIIISSRGYSKSFLYRWKYRYICFLLNRNICEMKGNGVKIGWIWTKKRKRKKNTETIKRRENSPVAQALLVIHARQIAVKRNFRILASLSESDLSSDGYVDDLLLRDIFILIIWTIRKMYRWWRHVSLASRCTSHLVALPLLPR